jgi:two-component system, NarL family, nitrate/nitrite response regulator NarL
MGIDLRVLVVAGDPLARAGLAALLANQPDCLVVGQVAPGTDFAAALEAYRPDVLLWDLGWEPAAAIDQLSALKEAGSPRVAALLPDEGQANAAWMAGARALLLRDAGPEQLAAALVAIAEGLAVFDPSFTPVIRPARQHETPPALIEELTPRELEVLRLMAEGLPNKAIAQRLEISEHTVKFHVNAVLGKLGVQSRTEAVVQATRRGLILL